MGKFYKEVKDSVICDLPEGKEVRFFIPESFFGSNIAVIVGEFVRLLGVFNYAIYDSKTDKPIGGLKTFKFPSVFLCQPSKIEKAKDIKLTKTSKKSDYRLLKFVKGDKLIVNTRVPQNVENIEDLFKLFIITGKVPSNIDYRTLWEYPIESCILNGNKFGINYQFFGILMSEICRDPNDISKPFRLSSAKKNKEWTNYIPISIKEIPKYVSPYVSITSENFDDSIVAASMMTNAKYSPLERVLTGKKPSK